MLKFFINIFLILFVSSSCAYAEVYNAGISYNVNTARIEAFSGIDLNIDTTLHKNHFVDANNKKNREALAKNKYAFKDRILTIFDDGDYSVYYKKEKIGYYYTSKGQMNGISIYFNNDYPIKSVKYGKSGVAISISLDVSLNESYIFNTKQKLIAHWIGDNCYDEKGELVLTRK